jgi:hypothetical protein
MKYMAETFRSNLAQTRREHHKALIEKGLVTVIKGVFKTEPCPDELFIICRKPAQDLVGKVDEHAPGYERLGEMFDIYAGAIPGAKLYLAQRLVPGDDKEKIETGEPLYPLVLDLQAGSAGVVKMPALEGITPEQVECVRDLGTELDRKSTSSMRTLILTESLVAQQAFFKGDYWLH